MSDPLVEELIEYLRHEISKPGEASAVLENWIVVPKDKTEEFLREWREWWALSEDERRRRLDEGDLWLRSTP